MTRTTDDRKALERQVLDTYQKENPSTYLIEESAKELKWKRDQMESLFIDRLKFPPKMFLDASLLELGAGTGEHSLFSLLWGAEGTFVEMNELACQRAEEIFRRFAPEARYTIHNQSLFEFETDEMFDITLSNGVLHHTHDKEEAFGIQVRHLRPGGFTILCLGTSHGMFQRNLQRAILFSLAEDEEEIVALADRLFKGHLDRAEKYGRRERRAIIYDTYIVPKLDSPSVSEVLGWFDTFGIVLYSAWPPLTPALFGDSPARDPIELGRMMHLLELAEALWVTHSRDDADEIAAINCGFDVDGLLEKIQNLVNAVNDVRPGLVPNLDPLAGSAAALERSHPSIDPYRRFTERLQGFAHEISQVVHYIQKREIDLLERFIETTQYLFQGSCGLGMNYFVGRKSAGDD